MKKNSITAEKGYNQSDIDNIKFQLPNQLLEIADSNTSEKQIENVKIHFKFVLANDFYKNELTAEQIADMESYLPENYEDDYID
tara:strand:- start:2455 stop:2706 length:252 start_codon:yes stop_codon:yes gene_type:complete